MSEWHTATVTEKTPAADGLVHLVLNVANTPLEGTHSVPGQCVKLSLDGKGEAYFAIASGPGKGPTLEFLVKRGAPLADALCDSPVGGQVRVSAVLGRGFPLEKARGKDVLLFATGSGISAIRSVIAQIRKERDAYGAVTLYFGVRTPSSFAYESELTDWERSRIRVVRTVSRPGNSGWQGLTGYVQAHIGDVDVSNAVAFLVGQKAMVKEVTEALEKRGLPQENVFLNF